MKTHWIKLLAVAAITIVAMVPGIAMADAPTMTILSPTGTIFMPGPGVVPIAMTVGHAELKNLTQFDVQVDELSIIGGQINPFTNENLCTTQLSGVSSACSTNGSDSANVTVNWTVTAVPSTHTLYIQAKHRSLEGIDEDVVVVQLLNVEYPAPPAVANAFINSQSSAIRKQFSAGIRGCVISQIAAEHAKNETYGPKGGPYDVTGIQTDVREFAYTCGSIIIP